MPAGQRALAAASALVCALLLAGSLRRPPPDASCPLPGELRARGGHSAEVGCSAQRDVRPLRGPARLLFGQPLDPNREDARALEALPGIGPARARAIVRERERRPFRTLRDLDRVPGIGPSTLEALAGLVAVGRAP